MKKRQDTPLNEAKQITQSLKRIRKRMELGLNQADLAVSVLAEDGESIRDTYHDHKYELKNALQHTKKNLNRVKNIEERERYSLFFSMLFFKAVLTEQIKKLIGFSLLFLAVANIISLLPSGGRFLYVAFLFSTAFCFIIVPQLKESLVLRTAKILSPLLFIFCLVSIRSSFDFFNITTLTNPIVVMFTDINIPLIDFIK
jgi:hypothetical protein